MVTTPTKMEAPNLSQLFTKAISACEQTWEVFVRGATATVFLHKATMLKAQTLSLKLMAPASVKRHQLVCMVRKWQGRGELTQAILTGSRVFYGDAFLYHITVKVQL